MRDVSTEQGEWFHQDRAKVEQQYQRKWDLAVMGDYCLFIHGEDETSCKRDNGTSHF
jgi:hypothetical protein